MSAFDAVVFDMDGLLVNTETLANRALHLAANDLGLELPQQLCFSMIGVAVDGCRRLLLDHYGDDAPADELFESASRHLEAQIKAGHLERKAGVTELLDHLDKLGLPRAVATSSSRAKAENHLRGAQLLECFDAIVTRDDVTHGKPKPDLYLGAARRLEVAPDRCLALEDSYNGVRAARAAGMQVIMVPDLLGPTDDMRRMCLAIVDDLHAVLPFVKP